MLRIGVVIRSGSRQDSRQSWYWAESLDDLLIYFCRPGQDATAAPLRQIAQSNAGTASLSLLGPAYWNAESLDDFRYPWFKT